jgi:hypothetical protein
MQNRHVRLMACAGALLLMAAAPSSGIHHLASSDRDHLLRADTFVSSERVDLLPLSVRTTFAKSLKAASFSMADPGEKFQVTDVITEAGLPNRRLVFAVRSSDHCLLHYERGGRGHSYHVLLFKLSGSTTELVWRAISAEKLNSMDQLRSAVKQDKLHDDPAYYW